MKTVKARVFSGGYQEFPVSRIEKFRPSTYGITVHENKILLLHNKNSAGLSLPGGGIDLGETNQEALKREFAEETGLDVEVGRLIIALQDFFYYGPTDQLVHTFLFFYACSPLSWDLHKDTDVDDEEAEKPRWIPLADLTPSHFVSHGREILNFAKTGVWQ